MFNRNKLRAKILEAGLTVKDIAIRLKKNEATIYRKMNNGEFTRAEMQELLNILNLDVKTFNEIFFT